jgi:hypothetical protein
MKNSTYTDFGESVSLVSLAAEVIFAHRLDCKLVAGDPPEPGSPLALHISRLTSMHERKQLARVLERLIGDSHRVTPHPTWSASVPLARARIMAAESRVEAVVVRLSAPRPVSAHGVARLRLLLSNGLGPVYRHGRGDLAAELDSVLAAL